MRTFSMIVTTLSMLGLALAVQAEDRDPEKAAAPKLEGKYTIVRGEEMGMAVPAERLQGSLVRFTKDEVVGTDKDRKELFVASYTLDTGTKPWKIRMKSKAPKEVETTGLIKKEGDQVVLIYALPGGKEPTEFKTADKQQMFWLKPVSGDRDGDKGEKK